jgi:hypothetical protein
MHRGGKNLIDQKIVGKKKFNRAKKQKRSKDRNLNIFRFACLFILGGPSPVGGLESIIERAHRVQRRSHIQQSELTVGVHLATVVVVDDVAHVLATAVHDPVVAIERQLVAHPVAEASSRREIGRLPAKFLQLGILALSLIQKKCHH